MFARFEEGLSSANLSLASFTFRHLTAPVCFDVCYYYSVSSPSIQILFSVVSSSSNSSNESDKFSGDEDGIRSSPAASVENLNSSCVIVNFSGSGIYRLIMVAEKVRLTNAPAFAFLNSLTINEIICRPRERKEQSLNQTWYNPMPAKEYISYIYKRRAGEKYFAVKFDI